MPLAQEAVEIRRTLARQNPDAFLPDLARELGALSQVLSALERPAEAAATAADAIRTLQPQFAQLPEAFGPLMQRQVRDYVNATKAAHAEPDAALLNPVGGTLRRLESL